MPLRQYAKKKAVNPPTAQDIHVFTAAIWMVALFPLSHQVWIHC